MTLDLETIGRIIRWREGVGVDSDLRVGDDEKPGDDTGRSSVAVAVSDERKIGEGVGEVPVTEVKTGKRVRFAELPQDVNRSQPIAPAQGRPANATNAAHTNPILTPTSNPNPTPSHTQPSSSSPNVHLRSTPNVQSTVQSALQSQSQSAPTPTPTPTPTPAFTLAHIRPDILAAYRAQVEIYNRQVLFYGVGTLFVPREIGGLGTDGDGGGGGGGGGDAIVNTNAIEERKMFTIPETSPSRVEEDRGVSGSNTRSGLEEGDGKISIGNEDHGALGDEEEDVNSIGTVQPKIGIGTYPRQSYSDELENADLGHRGDVQVTPGEHIRQTQHAHASPISIASPSGHASRSPQTQTTLPNHSLNQPTTTPRLSRIKLNDSELEYLGFDPDPDLDINSEDIKLSDLSSSLSSESSSSSSSDSDDYSSDFDSDSNSDSDYSMGLNTDTDSYSGESVQRIAKALARIQESRVVKGSESWRRRKRRGRDSEYVVQKSSLLAHIQTLKKRARATIKQILEEREEMRVLVERWRGLRRERREREEQRVRKGRVKGKGMGEGEVNVEGSGKRMGKGKGKERVVDMSDTACLEGGAGGGLGVAAA